MLYYYLQAESYQENILKPREEALRAKREDDIHRFTGWRDRGHKLGVKIDFVYSDQTNTF